MSCLHGEWREEDCEVCTMQNAHYEEIAKLRKQLVTASEQIGQLQLAHQCAAERAEAAEAKMKALDEQLPLGWRDSQGCLRYDQPMDDTGTRLYCKPVPPVDVQELRNEGARLDERIAELERKLAAQEEIWLEIVEQAHMAGQYREGDGVDPSASAAFEWIETKGRAMLSAAPKPEVNL